MNVTIEQINRPQIARHSQSDLLAEMRSIESKIGTWEMLESLAIDELLTVEERAAFQRLTVLRFLLGKQ